VDGTLRCGAVALSEAGFPAGTRYFAIATEQVIEGGACF
jgi:hypothetical protein